VTSSLPIRAAASEPPCFIWRTRSGGFADPVSSRATMRSGVESRASGEAPTFATGDVISESLAAGTVVSSVSAITWSSRMLSRSPVV